MDCKAGKAYILHGTYLSIFSTFVSMVRVEETEELRETHYTCICTIIMYRTLGHIWPGQVYNPGHIYCSPKSASIYATIRVFSPWKYPEKTTSCYTWINIVAREACTMYMSLYWKVYVIIIMFYQIELSWL